jgi:O-antigen/teichoic acid export membrane protein
MSVARSAMVTTAALAVSSGLNFIALFFWVRLLGPAEFGLYSLISAAALFLNAMLFEWLRVVGARTLYDPKAPFDIDPVQADSILALVAIITGLFGVTFLGISAIGLHIGGIDISRWALLIFLFVMSEMALAMLNIVSRVRLLAWQFFATMVARSAVSLVFGLVLVIGFNASAQNVIIATVLAQILTAAIIIVRDPLWRQLRLGKSSSANRAGMAQVLKLGAPLIISAALSFGVSIVDRYLVGGIIGPASVGYYSAPADVLQKTLGFLMMAINIAAYPVLVRAYEDRGQSIARKILEDNFALQLALGLPVAIAFIILAPGLANLLLGAAYRDTATILLPWIGFAALFRLLTNMHLLMVFQLTRRMKLMLVAPCITLAILVPGAIWALPRYGLLGMAIVALAAHAVSYLVCAVLAMRIFPFSLFTSDIGKILIANGVMGLALIPFAHVVAPVPLLLVSGAAGIVYLAALLMLRIKQAAPIESRLKALLRRWRK